MTKIFQLLKHFSSSDLKKFQEMLKTPFFNRRTDVQEWLVFYIKSKKNRREKVVLAHFEKKVKIDSKDWHLLCSRLFKLGEKFIQLEALDHNFGQQKILLAEGLRRKKLSNLFTSAVHASQKLLQKKDIQDAQFWQQKFQLENEYYDFIASNNRKAKTNLPAVNHALDTFFITQKLKSACLNHARATMNQERYDVHLLPEIVDYVEQQPNIQKIPSVEVYYLYYKAISDQENEQWFTQFRQSIERNRQYFQPREQRDILLFATNYCIRHLNIGKAIFIREAFELYRLNLSAGFLIEDGVLPESTFGNIVALAAKLKEYDWAKEFIEEHKIYLKPVFQAPLFHFSCGRLHFEEGNFDEALQHLALVETKAGFLLLGTKILQLKIYFEQEEFELMEYLLDSLRVYLQRQNNLGYRKQNYERIVYFFRKLMEIPFAGKEKKQQFLTELMASEEFSEKEWILEKTKNP